MPTPANATAIQPEFYSGTLAKIPSTYGEALRLIASQPGSIAQLVLVISGLALHHHLGTWTWLDAAVAVLIISTWGIAEWILHSYLLHAMPLPLLGIRPASILSRIHAYHHQDPWDFGTLFFKWPTVLLGWALLYGLGILVTWDYLVALTFASCYMAMITRYEWFHVLTHSHINSHNRYMSTIMDNHRAHHFDPSGAQRMGISSVLGDKVFGTYPRSNH